MADKMCETLVRQGFLKLWKLYMIVQDPYARRYCIKVGRVIRFRDLISYSCWSCPHYILNGGECDPI